MKTTTTILLTMCVALMSSCSSQLNNSKPTSGSSSTVKTNWSSLEHQVANTVIRKRKSLGKSGATYHDGIAEVAKKHSQYLVKKYVKTGVKDPSHKGIKGRVGKLSLKYSMARTGENIAYLHKSHPNKASYMLSMWMASPLHRENLLKNWNFTGVGIVEAPDGTIFVTQLFGLKTDFTF